MQSETFTIVNTLKKTDLDKIVKSFPLVANDIQQEAKKRMRVLEQIDIQNTCDDEMQ